MITEGTINEKFYNSFIAIHFYEFNVSFVRAADLTISPTCHFCRKGLGENGY